MRYRLEHENKKKARLKKTIMIAVFSIIILGIFLLISYYFVVKQAKAKKESENIIYNQQKKIVESTPQAKQTNEKVEANEYVGQESMSDILNVSFENSYTSARVTSPIENDPLWNLILLNPGNGISKEIPMKRVKFDEQYVDERVAEAYQAMINEAKKSGITLYLRSGYRSIETQRNNYNNTINGYVQNGETAENALKMTEQYYTRAGHSEHHSGLALDIITPEYHKYINSLDERFAETEAYEWLKDNCDRFGFILRYPKEKADITKINFEPWHYRYVGIEHAVAIKKSGLCLEEYLFKLLNGFEEEGADENTREAIALYAESFPKSMSQN